MNPGRLRPIAPTHGATCIRTRDYAGRTRATTIVLQPFDAQRSIEVSAVFISNLHASPFRPRP